MEEIKNCYKCKEDKELSEFNKDKSKKDGLNSQCKTCKGLHGVKYNKANKEKINQGSKNYYNQNTDYFKSEERKKYAKKYRNENKEHIKKYLKDYMGNYFKNKRLNNIEYKIKDALGTRLYVALKNEKITKSQRTLELLGCPVEDLKYYIEQQFKPEMNWNNWGSIWELDHIIPCASFNLIDIKQQEECFHYSNLQPLFKTTQIAESFGYFDQIGNRNKNKN